ncbi:MAG TPA: sigma-54 dependent transcriptional regulator [Thermoanaerobaculia bacterium]|nr:sigma-54 dependent transcriptional regulator [Thermoanaerobaculia bacterium]
MVRLALIENEPELRASLTGMLSPAGYPPEVFESAEDFLGSESASTFELIVTEFPMEGTEGADILKACRAVPDPPSVLLVTTPASAGAALEAMRLGASDYVSKPVDPRELAHRIGLVLELRRVRRECRALSGEVRRRHGLAPPIGESPIMQDFLARARKASASSSTVLILGETGIGKDVIARYIQSTGPRADKIYLTMNCAGIPESQFESELFGHARGAFPGAHSSKAGLFEDANGGTLFLDEIGSMALPAQTNLLKVLDEGAVRRLGEKRATKVDVRLIVATNRDLDSLIAAGEFREDLYYRVSVVTLVVPPLRKRPEDIEPLARHFLAESVRRHRKPRTFAPGTLELLLGYSYPGNIRELRYAIEHAGILSEDGVLRPEDFPFARVRAAGAGAAATTRRVRTRPIAQEITPERLAQVLREQGGNRVRAARALQISRATLYRLLDRSDSKPSGSSESEIASG